MRDTSQALITLTGETSEFGYSSFFQKKLICLCLSLCQNYNFLFVFVFEVYVSKFQVFHCVRVDPRCGRSLSFPRCVYHLWVQGEFIFISVFCCVCVCVCLCIFCVRLSLSSGFPKHVRLQEKIFIQVSFSQWSTKSKLNIMSVISTLLTSFQSEKRKFANIENKI